MVGFFLAILFLLFCLGCVISTLVKGDSKGKSAGHDDSRYARTRSFMDFDSGVDTNKVGDSKYPNAGIDSVMKQEFLGDLINDEK